MEAFSCAYLESRQERPAGHQAHRERAIAQCRAEVGSLIEKIGGSQAYFEAQRTCNTGGEIDENMAILLGRISRVMGHEKRLSACGRG